MKLHVRKNDTVVVISGKDQGKTGEVLKVYPKTGKVLVQGVNIVKKHQKPNRANAQGGIIEKEGAICYLTRYGDYDLSNNNTGSRKKSDLNNRAKIINKSEADMYISIHLNSISSSTWSGAQVFYGDVNTKNKDLAILMQQILSEDLKTKREIKEINNMLLNRKITIPGVLIEVGFLSNPNDRYKLQQSDYQYKIAESIKRGIIKYFEIEK